MIIFKLNENRNQDNETAVFALHFNETKRFGHLYSRKSNSYSIAIVCEQIGDNNRLVSNEIKMRALFV